ncbi:hypothetical protein [Wocania ichthyoenteri]|uniref:hypothetical protein n=1 Tax=Wocania ichthyoenteri TaxID=1230531 RepID=UPI0012E0361E|nr:hypothetical protein [Wocania ichthyoenteri]
MAKKTIVDTVCDNISGLFVKQKKRVRRKAKRVYKSYRAGKRAYNKTYKKNKRRSSKKY